MMGQPMQSHLVSLLCQGVFERFPELRFVFAEGGFVWAAEVLWRLDRNWKSLRDEVPWLKKVPSGYLGDHVRFTTQPFPEPARREHLVAILEAIEAERTLLYASDYPHWDYDDPVRALARVPRSMRSRIYHETAVETFGRERLYA